MLEKFWKNFYNDINSKFLKAFPSLIDDNPNASQRKEVVAIGSSFIGCLSSGPSWPGTPAPAPATTKSQKKNHGNKRHIVGQAASCEQLEVVAIDICILADSEHMPQLGRG